jgi:hypothetical protein
MRALGPVRRPRLRAWLATLVVVLMALLAVSGCGINRPEPTVLADKGTPYSDL